MLFPTFEFVVFFCLTFVVSWILRPRPLAWRVFILAASYVFYGWWDPRFVLLLVASTLCNQGAAVAVHRAATEQAAKAVLAATVVLNLVVLGFFKYYGFFVESATELLDSVGLGANPPLLQVILPVGISFFTFQALSYVIDTYRGDTEPAGTLDFAVYLAFFPHLVAGPIVRARELIPQLAETPDPRRIEGALALRLIFAGLFKKVVISSYVATAIADPVFADPTRYESLDLLFATYAYAIQIYADFSGYTDIAIGCALLLGIRFPQNFDAPYTAESMQSFWRRWHMTLSFWLRDYLYIPLGGNRGSAGRAERNLFLTMVIGGLWHGAAWTFVAWGAIHGAALVVERRWNLRRAAEGWQPTRWTPVVRWLVTFHVVCLAWVFFRSDSFATAFELVGGLVTRPGLGELVTPMLVFVIALMLASQFVPPPVVDRFQVVFSRAAPVVQGVALGLGLLLIDALGPQGVAPFIYFQF